MKDFEKIDLPREPRSDGKMLWYDEFGFPASQPVVGISVAKTGINGLFVSTVLLGLNHSFGIRSLRIFETMIFGHDRHSEYQWRYANMMEALLGHQQIVTQLRAGVDLDELIVGPFLTEAFDGYRDGITAAVSDTLPEGG